MRLILSVCILVDIFITGVPLLASFLNHLISTSELSYVSMIILETSEEYLVKGSSNHEPQMKRMVVACGDKS